jgi:NAD(P)-dependent dehydrogenase (short-subunit alcohol dehydrogenase family)
MSNAHADRPVAIVTGAARGIGAATARELASCGHRLVLVDILAAELSALAAELQAEGAEVLPIVGDLATIEFCRAIVEQAIAQFSRLDLLVNNAACRKVETMRETNLADWDRTLRICLTAPAFLARFAAEVMQPARRGVIVNITTIRASFNDGTAAAYVAAKGGLEALTSELATLYGPQGIRVVSLAPGAIDTDLSGDLAASEVMRDVVADCIDHTPLARFGTPQEIARTVCWLASDAASFISGATIVADGGLSHNHYGLALKRRMKPEEFQ